MSPAMCMLIVGFVLFSMVSAKTVSDKHAAIIASFAGTVFTSPLILIAYFSILWFFF